MSASHYNQRNVYFNGSYSSSVLCYLPDQSALLSASLRYGIVSRSFAFTGKVLKGELRYVAARVKRPSDVCDQ